VHYVFITLGFIICVCFECVICCVTFRAALSWELISSRRPRYSETIRRELSKSATHWNSRPLTRDSYGQIVRARKREIIIVWPDFRFRMGTRCEPSEIWKSVQTAPTENTVVSRSISEFSFGFLCACPSRYASTLKKTNNIHQLYLLAQERKHFVVQFFDYTTETSVNIFSILTKRLSGVVTIVIHNLPDNYRVLRMIFCCCCCWWNLCC